MRDRKLERFWRKTLRRRERSGVTVAEFCQQEGLTASSYNFWRGEIKRRDRAQQSEIRAQAAPGSSILAPVQVIDDRRPASVEIVGPSGMVVRVPEEATTEHVRRILQLVQEIF